MSKITLKDIAKALNLSVSSVSKALSDSHEISELTKIKVKDYAEANGFTINKVAQSLKIGRTNTIGVVACAINNNFISQVLEGIQKASIETGYDIIIMQSLEDRSIEKSCIEVLKSRGIDGLLIAPVSEDSNLDLLEQLQEAGIPVVLFDRIQNKLDTFKFGVDNFEGAYNATMHLLERGKRNILHITSSQLGVAQERFNGFKEAHDEFGLVYDRNHYIDCNLKDIDLLDGEIRNAIHQAYSSAVRPDAIFGATDVITERTLGILAELEIQVPSEIAVIGFANTTIAFALNPALSTISQPAVDMGYLAMDKLVYIIQNKHREYNFETVELKTKMHIRKSTM